MLPPFAGPVSRRIPRTTPVLLSRPSKPSVSPLCTPTSVAMFLQTAIHLAKLRAAVSPSSRDQTVLVGSAHVRLRVGVCAGAGMSEIQMMEPDLEASRNAFYALYAAFPHPIAKGFRLAQMPTGKILVPVGHIRLPFLGVDPTLLSDWVVAALRLADVQWVTVDGSGVAWA